MFKIAELRKYVRIEKPYIARFLAQSNDDGISSNWNMVAVDNLSAGGIFFYALENMKVGTILDLKISISRSLCSIICAGKIVRVKRIMDTSVVGFGIEFTEIDEFIAEAIDNTSEQKVE
ncbi:MAG: PilZ domain-containing protein [Candidatus Scalindua sp.]|nr:PilZ domain-containing protein [Candidatus Scalindua sp.]